MNKEKFVYSIFIDTTPEKLWGALTEGEWTQKFWAGRYIESDFKVGSDVTMYTDSGKSKIDFIGKILKSEPPTLLSYTFHVQVSEESRAEEPSVVTYEIESLKDVVKLTVIHDEIPSGLEGLSRGWTAIISGLKSVLETGKPLSEGIWKWHEDQGYKTA